MDKQLFDLYKEMLSLSFSNGKTVYERITPDDLCLAGHHVGRLFDNGLLIYGQAMNGWQNEDSTKVASLISEVMLSSENYREMYVMADYNGWHGEVNGNPASYYYKRSKFWKLNYQVITGANDSNFEQFYIPQTLDKSDREELLKKAWSQSAAWSNLYKVSFSEGGNPDDSIIDVINDVSLRIISREIEMLKPSRVLFNTGENFFSYIAMNGRNSFNVERVPYDSNVLFTGRYEYAPNQSCKIVVCKRPDDRRLHYTNADIVKAAQEILTAFEE
ncbi:hypothetical protein SAMN05216343_10741 [Oscillibacter sp. PC13]|uniref:hypothetical protein n=1 Tax=Oscillibacter sp. PC13 TaxID=1855299 RepID=UPI0008E5B24E|nr:hypothetical protein [Oscillibacter sp. PC13]SFP41352.1 hypothetical protein SAMN05216343_10741 [Oscillibacter sp. PC13]